MEHSLEPTEMMQNEVIQHTPTKRRSSKIDLELLSRPEKQQEAFDFLLARRNGSVLTRKTILKSDHFGSTSQSLAEVRLLGAPNFRESALSIYGAGQPTVYGLSTILRLLRCGPNNACRVEQACTWFSTREEPLIYINGRPFVLRDIESPTENIRSYAGISSFRLEQLEARLKTDVLEEASRNNGVILVHDESEESKIMPCLSSVEKVTTSQEIFEEMKESGFCVEYKRIPISHEQAPTDEYIDEYVSYFKEMSKDHAVVFSCGIGVGRTTFSMVLGLLLKQSLQAAPLISDGPGEGLSETKSAINILKLVSLLEQGFASEKKYQNRSAIEWTLSRGNIIEDLQDALSGNYHVINELLKVLDNGHLCKRLVDEAIDKSEALVNIREQIFLNRVKHYVNEESSALDSALGYLERYYCLITFCAYINDPSLADKRFSQWIRERRDIWNMLQGIRKRAYLVNSFRPIADLSSFGVTLSEKQNSVAEFNVIKSRAGSILSAHTILKVDYWMITNVVSADFPGAPNFRQLGPYLVFATSQPTMGALQQILAALSSKSRIICWINVREEPIVYIDDNPYVLRDRHASLRNIKSYSGINAQRLESMEEQLKEDILGEASTFKNRILVHTEIEKESIAPFWLSVEDKTSVRTMRDVFKAQEKVYDTLKYIRVPITAEDPPEPEDLDSLMQAITGYRCVNTAFVFNCQMGASRSTMSAIVATLILNWLDGNSELEQQLGSISRRSAGMYYRVVHAIVRILKDGINCKMIVDWLVDNSGSVVNLRDAIERNRLEAERHGDPIEKRRACRKASSALKRYCLLILFQAYLVDLPREAASHPADLETFSRWITRHQEIARLLNEIDSGSVESWLDEPPKTPAPGHAPASEVLEVVKHRRGSVLSAMTILKFDHFPGCQKQSLAERIDGAPNFRKVVLREDHSAYGLAMPTEWGVRNTLGRINSDCLWFCLREEPVVYVNGNPYVLRIVKNPVANLEMTGIHSERVELMEERLKIDVLDELKTYQGKLLLHEEDPASGLIVPTWEVVLPDAIKTPREVMNKIKAYSLASSCSFNYLRVPITDEQGPIPEVFDILLNELWKNYNKSTPASPIFNCQMGRGRTTTGIVISAIFCAVRTNYADVLTASSGTNTDAPISKVSAASTRSDSPHSSASDSGNDEDEIKHYLNGEYKLVLQLLQVLENGKLAKQIVDEATDRCSDIQNLRTAILDYRQKDEIHRGTHYLLRYFFLICFAEYLVQVHHHHPRHGNDGEFQGKASLETPAPAFSFLQWLNDRKEIGNMTQRRELIDLY